MTRGHVQRIFCVHGDPEASEALAQGIRVLGVRDVRVPIWKEEVEI